MLCSGIKIVSLKELLLEIDKLQNQRKEEQKCYWYFNGKKFIPSPALKKELVQKKLKVKQGGQI